MQYIAELSGNHQGSKELALKLVEKAAWAGATAIKFQCFDPERLAKKRIANPEMKRTKWGYLEDLAALYRETHTPFEWFPDLAKEATANGINWFASAFSDVDVARLVSLGCRTIKISAFEWGDPEIIGVCFGHYDHLIMSVKDHVPDEEIEEVLHKAWGPKITLLHATDYGDGGRCAGRIEHLQKFGIDVGLSDHSADGKAAVQACALGVTMIERHIRWWDDVTSPDWSFSSDPDEFKEMVRRCDMVREAIREG